MTDKISRGSLGFEAIVRERFSFLRQFGFREIDARSTIVSYGNGNLGVTIYHGRQSYEVGVEIGRRGQWFPSDLAIAAVDKDAYRKYRRPAATTKTALACAVARQASLVRKYAEPALRGDRSFFLRLGETGDLLVRERVAAALVSRTKPMAAAAFRERRYADAVKLYESMLDHLSVADKAKLAAARRRAQPRR